VIIDVIQLQSAAITVTVIIAECSRLTSMITQTNRNAAVIIVSRRHDHEFVIIAPIYTVTPALMQTPTPTLTLSLTST